MSNVPSAADAASRAVNIYRAIGRTNPLYADALENVLITAGFPSGTAVYKTVMGCVPVNPATGRRDRAASDLSLPCAHLVRTWLLRHHLVALTYGMVDNPSFNGQNAPRSVQEAIRVLAEYFNS